ncbi:MAG: PRC-barrel domain-containing protein [Elusimicrobia bacterium]|nr:PRC-barrel domain-containing protein [Elusimicrobiota bacterium]
MGSIRKKPAKTSWKVADILGFEVFDQDGNLLGLLADVISTGNNDVWTIKSDTEELLIPALKSIVTKVDISAKRIFVSLPDGYVDIYGTKVKLEDAVVVEEFSGITVYED